jgi:starvation-inducible outer membrane lipoprotein
VFPPEALAGIEPDFDFARWRVTAGQAKPTKVQLGGRIVQSEVTGDTVVIVAGQLPIVDHPAYGPKDNGKQNGEFVVAYQGKVEAMFLQPGNRVIVVGTTHPSMVVSVDGLPRSFPTLTGQCLHFWNTEGREIGDFPDFDGGYVTLAQQTVCVKHP